MITTTKKLRRFLNEAISEEEVAQELSTIQPGDLIDFDMPSVGLHSLRVDRVTSNGVSGVVERAPEGENVGWEADVALEDIVSDPKGRGYFAREPQDVGFFDRTSMSKSGRSYGDSKLARVMYDPERHEQPWEKLPYSESTSLHEDKMKDPKERKKFLTKFANTIKRYLDSLEDEIVDSATKNRVLDTDAALRAVEAINGVLKLVVR